MQGDVGSPLIETVTKNSENENYIVGVTMPRIQCGKKYFHRFIRINYALSHIQKVMEDIQFLEEADTECDNSSNQTELPDKICKRRKL